MDFPSLCGTAPAPAPAPALRPQLQPQLQPQHHHHHHPTFGVQDHPPPPRPRAYTTSSLTPVSSFGDLRVALHHNRHPRQPQVSFEGHDDAVDVPPTTAAAATPGQRTPGGSRRKSVVTVARDRATAIKEHRFLRNTVMRRRSSIASAVSTIPASRRQEYTQAFNLFGPDKNGKVAAESIARVLHTLGWSPNVESLKMLVAEVDYNGDGAIGLDEFMVMLHGPPRSARDVEAVLDAFKSMAFDTVGFGKISVKRLRCLLQHVGMRIQPAVVDTLLEDAKRMQEKRQQQQQQGEGATTVAAPAPTRGAGSAAATAAQNTSPSSAGGWSLPGSPASVGTTTSARGLGEGGAGGGSGGGGGGGGGGGEDSNTMWDYAELVRLISDVDLSSKMYEERLRNTVKQQQTHHHHALRQVKPARPMTEAERERRRRDARDKRVLLGKTPRRQRL